MTADSNSTILNLKNQVQKFCEERDWDQFHPIKDLAIGISTEGNELLELFRFKSDQEIVSLLKDPTFKEKVENEISDVLFFILRLAQMNQIDLTTSLVRKLEKNATKYPIEKFRGSNKKYNE